MAATPKIGDWIQLTQDASLLCIDTDSNDWFHWDKFVHNVKKGTIGKVQGRINSKYIILFNGNRYRCLRSEIKFLTISPKKYKSLEILYGKTD